MFIAVVAFVVVRSRHGGPGHGRRREWMARFLVVIVMVGVVVVGAMAGSVHGGGRAAARLILQQ